jgi:hypothetical protein
MKVDPMEQIASRILLVRGQRVMLDADHADVYGVSTNALNQAVKRNLERFPKDFAFQLNASETVRLSSQIAISNPQLVTRIHPWVFTDRGVLMAACVLHSKQAVQASVQFVRASVRLRELVAADRELAILLDELERRVSHHDEEITSIIRAIRELATPPEPRPGRRIGFISGD